MNHTDRTLSASRLASLSRGFVALDPYRPYRGGQYFAGLFVPAHVEEASRIERFDVETFKAAKVPENGGGSPESPSAGAAVQPASKSARKQQSRADKEAEVWEVHALTPLRNGSCRYYRVFEPAEALRLFNRIDRLHKDDRPRYERVYEHLREEGHLRPIARPGKAALRNLSLTQPHMAPVVEFIQLQLDLSWRARKPLRIPPILLVGEAGIGKTHFAQALAKALAAPISVQRLDSDLTGALMLGTDKKWSSSHHGLLFELLAMGDCANPVVVLDEIDKINRRDHQVQASLYSLLEPVSACSLRDISLEMEFDAGMVTWIATANDASRLDEPLRSRFKEFHIQIPNAEQCLVLAREVIRATIERAGVRGFEANHPRLARHVAHLTARQISQVVQEAMARALKAGRRTLQLGDLPAWISTDTDGDHAPTLRSYLH